jgi:hypothetical protein
MIAPFDSWRLVVLSILVPSTTIDHVVTSFQMSIPILETRKYQGLHRISSCVIRRMSDWSTFQPLNDDDDEDDEIFIGRKIDRRVYAVENDDPEVKAAVGATLDAPKVLADADPIFVPAGSQLDFDEETVLGLLSACRTELGTLFGYSEENRGVGITGSVEYVEIDGGTVVLSLAGRYWHQRTTVLDRVANYLQQRIPEIIEVVVDDPYQLSDEANRDAF